MVTSRNRRVAILLVGVGDLSSGGGTERYFADIFERYGCSSDARFDLTLITDVESLARLREVGRDPDPARTLVVPSAGRVGGLLRYGVSLLRLVEERHFDLLHVALVNPRYLLFLWRLGRRSLGRRPRIAINVVDCTLAHTYDRPAERRSLSAHKVYWLYRLFFHQIPLDGVYAWYRLFRERFAARLPGSPYIAAARYFFVDTDRFRPAGAKQNTVVWAGRLAEQKHPLLFIESIARLRVMAPRVYATWSFHLYGQGPLAQRVRVAISEAGLGDRVVLTASPRMSDVFGVSRVFVSTQDYDNFSSLSMLEAMSAGNAVIARPVGQTADWVRHGINGLIVEQDTADGLAYALAACLADEARLTLFEAHSRELATRDQCFDNVRRDLDAFWEAVLDDHTAK